MKGVKHGIMTKFCKKILGEGRLYGRCCLDMKLVKLSDIEVRGIDVHGGFLVFISINEKMD